jgi:hypothetical protein
MVVRFKIQVIKYKVKDSNLEIFQFSGIIICLKMWEIRQDTTSKKNTVGGFTISGRLDDFL